MQKVAVASVAIATTKFLIGMSDCMVDSDVGTSNSSLLLRSLHACGRTYVRSPVSTGLD